MHISRDYFGGQIVDQHRGAADDEGVVDHQPRRREAVEHRARRTRWGAKEAVRVIEGVPFLMIYKFSY